MPTLTLRAVGMSYLIEGLGTADLDTGPLVADLAAEFGPALAPLGSSPDPDHCEALLVDRKAASRDELRGRLAEWVRDAGGFALAWTDEPAGGRSVLHFDLGPRPA